VLRVHSALPDALTTAVDAALGEVGHVAHGDADAMRAAKAAAADADAIALLGPYRSREVAEVVEATAPAELPLLAPVATWAGVTRDDEPGCDDDPARHHGTVLRMLARDTEVAARLAADVRAAGQRALVVRAGTSTARSSTGSSGWSACRGSTMSRLPTWSCCAGSQTGPRCVPQWPRG
jgi:hypothetical protein